MEKEIWKDVVGYEGLYQVSNLGRIKRTFVLRQHIDRKGYYFVNLSKNGKVKCCRVHQLVGKSFIPNPQRIVLFFFAKRLKSALFHLFFYIFCDFKPFYIQQEL